MKKIALLLLLSIIFASCQSTTMIIMPGQNIQMPAYPPQSHLNNSSKYNSLGMNGYFNNSIFINNTNNLFRKNFVYLK